MAAAAEIVAALVAPWEAAAAVLGVAALARTVVSLEAVVQPEARGAAVALVVKVVATAATAARAAEAATAVGMVGKMARRTPCVDLYTSCNRMELLCTRCWDPC